MKTQLFFAVSLAAAAVNVAGPAVARDSQSFRIGGIVRTVCRVEVSGQVAPQSNGVVDFGNLTQLCNAKSGYRVIMQHPTNIGNATLTVDGRVIQLSNGNETVIIDEARPTFKTSSAQLDTSTLGAPVGFLSFRIEPKGAVY